MLHNYLHVIIYIMQCITSHYSDVFTSLMHDFSTPRTGMCNPHQCSVPCFHSSLSPVHKKYGLLQQYVPSYNGHTKCTDFNPQHVFKHVPMTVGQCMCDKVIVIINTTLRECDTDNYGCVFIYLFCKYFFFNQHNTV